MIPVRRTNSSPGSVHIGTPQNVGFLNVFLVRALLFVEPIGFFFLTSLLPKTESEKCLSEQEGGECKIKPGSGERSLGKSLKLV